MSSTDPGRVRRWGDPWGTGYNTDFDLDDRYVKARDDLDRKIQAVEDALWKLQNTDFRGLDDPRLVDRRAKVERLRDHMTATSADVLAALPPEPPPQPGRLLSRFTGRAEVR
jgi:hypothetical protein